MFTWKKAMSRKIQHEWFKIIFKWQNAIALIVVIAAALGGSGVLDNVCPDRTKLILWILFFLAIDLGLERIRKIFRLPQEGPRV
jgi:hypothetical protein